MVWRFEHDVLARTRRVHIEQHSEDDFADMNVHVSMARIGGAGVSTEDPGLAWAEGTASYALQWPGITASTEARASLHSDPRTYYLDLELVVRENDTAIANRRWTQRYPRKLQ